MYAVPTTNRLLIGQKSRLAAFIDGSLAHGQCKKPMCHSVETVEVRQIAAQPALAARPL